MFQYFESLDQTLFLWLNGFHNSWVDEIMWVISSKYIWIPLYIFIFIQLLHAYKKQVIRIILMIIVIITLSDGISSGIIKDSVKRYRPSHNTQISSQVHVYTESNGSEYRGGQYGFVSSHASNSFAIALFAFLLLRKKSKHWRWIFLWAIIVSYSRIYLGVHYPADIIGGAIVGILSTCLVYFSGKALNFFQECKAAPTASLYS
jgi:undecaprenyl-diphosphatase